MPENIRYMKSLKIISEKLIILNERCDGLQKQITTITETSKLLLNNIELQAEMIKLLMER